MNEEVKSKQRSIGYLALIRRNPNFRFLWFGQIVSLLGDWFNLIASAALVASLTESGLAVGALFVVRMLAPFLSSPIAGVIADRYNRKRILIMADLARAGVVLCFLLVREPADVWLLYSLTALQLGISGFFFPARNAILPDVVSPTELGAANVLSSATWSVMLAFGAALGGLISGGFGVYPAFVIDGFTFLLSAWFISRIAAGIGNPRQPEGGSPRLIGQYLEGIRYLFHHPDILAISFQKPALGLFFGATFDIVQISIAEQVFVIGIGGGVGLGLMYAATGVGTGLGPLVARYFTGDRGPSLRRALILAYLMGSIGLLAVAPLFSLKSVLLGNCLRGIGGGIIWVFSTQLLLKQVPANMRGRVFATEMAVFTLFSALGSATSGALLDTTLGIPGVSVLMAVTALVPGSLWAIWTFSRPPTRLSREV